MPWPTTGGPLPRAQLPSAAPAPLHSRAHSLAEVLYLPRALLR